MARVATRRGGIAKAYLKSLKKKASDAPSTSGMFIIEVNIVSHDNLWVLDTSCDSHICTNNIKAWNMG